MNVRALPFNRLYWRRQNDAWQAGMIAWFTRLLALGILAGIVVGIALAIIFNAERNRADLLLKSEFGKRGLVTNEFAYWNHGRDGSRVSDDWTATSGSLFARDGAGWTGPPDRGTPDASSSNATDSAVFRLRSNRGDFGDIGVSFELKLNGLVTTPRTPAHDYDGVHVWLHYQNPNSLYYVSVSRRDGRIVIGKKLAGRYTRLSVRATQPLPFGRWQHIETTIVSDNAKSVTIRLLVNGKLVERVTDQGKGGQPITAPGRIGLRGDNADFEFRALAVRRVS